MSRAALFKLYVTDKKSVAQMSKIMNCSQSKVNYWLSKYKIEKRNISDAVYQFKNPLGNPFSLKYPGSIDKAILYGLGLGLYWGEGLKRGTGGMRLTNSNPRLIKKFIHFLEEIFSINKKSLKFILQIFSDISQDEALEYWIKEIGVSKNQFYKVIVSKVRGEGTYKYRSEHGVVIVYFNNTRLKKCICGLIDNI
jgi:hypothetical protein